ncbi:MAG TPA: glutamate--tRNA ligase family protein [Thermoanaerobaculia bacterium]|jgi:glutamyl-tRNA synthetase
MVAMLSDDTIIDLLPAAAMAPDQLEEQFPPRALRAGAEVTRFAPSPTGYVHIGGIMVSLLAQSIARQTGGVFILRIEDTDQERYVPDAVNQLERALEYCGIVPDESGDVGRYGPYRQSARQGIYDTYIAALLRRGSAYPCFCTPEDLTELSNRQRESGTPTGYWGPWARCRGMSQTDVTQRLRSGASFVIRFAAPATEGESRVQYVDLIRGPLELADNRNDVVIRKTGGLPTYHLAHPVDDYLMRVTTVVRADEWLPSVPLHLQLFDALKFPVPVYAHIAPLVKLEGRSRRKLSKRKDPEATVDFYISAGYPSEGLLIYLRGLANSRLLDGLPDEVLAAPLRLQECSHSGALVDLAKLEHICRELVAEMPLEHLADRILDWASAYDADMSARVRDDRGSVIRALGLSVGQRKDICKWSDFRPKFGFLLTALFEPVRNPADARFAPLSAELVLEVAGRVAETYRHEPDHDAWFAQIRRVADALGFAPTVREFKQNRDGFKGSITEVARVVRVLLTGLRDSPDLFEVAQVLGEVEVRRRLSSLSA